MTRDNIPPALYDEMMLNCVDDADNAVQLNNLPEIHRSHACDISVVIIFIVRNISAK